VIWSLSPPAPPEVVRRICRDLGLPPVLASVLWARGFGESPAGALSPPLQAGAIPGLEAAAERLEHALRAKKRILVHGDYDADGITGTAVLTLGLRALGGEVTPYVPNRLTDGYGISPERVEEHGARADLLVTVDCGIGNLEEIAALKRLGVEVIITDHHTLGERPPDCLVVHPKLEGRALPLTGSGVAYHLLWALHRRLGLEAPLEYSDLAAIGTIADVAPLLGENRALVREGLARLKDSKWPGLKACVSRNLMGRAPRAWDVAFVIAPRLNAAGRMGEADAGIELLTTHSERRARELAVYLDAYNAARRKVQEEMLTHALTLVDPEAPALVLEDESWHPGVMGLVASNLLERFYKPVFIAAKGKGSVRSTPGISAVKALDSAREYLKRYGGHSQAAGFAIEGDQLDSFREAIYTFVKGFDPPRRVVTADALLNPREITRELLEAIDKLEPYGEGHAAPRFALTGAVQSARAVGQGGKHLQLRLPGIKGVAWSQGDLAPTFPRGSSIDAVARLKENSWNGTTSIEFESEALRRAAPFSFADATMPGREIRRLEEPAELLQDAEVHVYGSVQEPARRWRPGAPLPKRLLLTEVPLHDEPLEACEPLAEIVESDAALYFALDEAALQALEARLRDYPSLTELRLAFVRLQGGRALPFTERKNALCRLALDELELIDGAGHPRRGLKRDPYSSQTFLAGLMAHYRLNTFLNAYRHTDEASFAHAVLTLFGPERRQ
jgi:single-stranded-DNA-specific exonuclease